MQRALQRIVQRAVQRAGHSYCGLHLINETVMCDVVDTGHMSAGDPGLVTTGASWGN